MSSLSHFYRVCLSGSSKHLVSPDRGSPLGHVYVPALTPTVCVPVSPARGVQLERAVWLQVPAGPSVCLVPDTL